MNGFGAPRLSELTECRAPEVEEPKNFLGSLVLNNLFAVRYPDPMRRLTLMFGRRADNAVREYRTGRELLLSYLQRLPQGNSHFLVAMRATTHFEHCIGSVCQANALLNRLIDVADARDPIEAPESQDCDHRLKCIWNRAKHFDEDIASTKRAAEDITAPVWLTNTGLSAETAVVTWKELHTVLSEHQKALKFLAEDMPQEFAKRQKDAGQIRNENT